MVQTVSCAPKLILPPIGWTYHQETVAMFDRLLVSACDHVISSCQRNVSKNGVGPLQTMDFKK